MQVTLEATGIRVTQLEQALTISKDQITALTNLVSGLLSNDRDRVTQLLPKGTFSGTVSHAAEAGTGVEKSLPFEAPEHRVTAAPAGLASAVAEQAAAGAEAAAAEGAAAGLPTSAEQAAVIANKGSTTLVGSGRDRGNLAALLPGGGSPEGIVDRPHATAIGSSLQPGQDALGALRITND